MRRNSFDALRLIAAALVLYAHSFAVAGFPQPQIFGGTLGGFGVWIFFATSGYLITASWQSDPRLGTFVWKRCLRILPALVPLAIALGIVSQLGLFDANPRGALNPSLWSLPVEARCYALVAILGVAGALRKPLAVPALVAVLLVLLAWQISPSDVALSSHLGAVAGFAGGMLMRSIPRHGAIAAACGLVLTTFPLYRGHFQHVDVVWALTIPYLVVYGAERVTLRLKHDLSYGLYLWGWPVLQVLVAVGVTSPGALLPLALAATSVVAAASWFAVERPALRLKGHAPRIPQRRPAVRAEG